MLCTCESCRYIFSTDMFDEQCPDCGKYTVRPSSAEETTKHEADMQLEGQIMLFEACG